MATAVIDRSTVELVMLRGDDVLVEPIASPHEMCAGFPVSLSAADIDGDGSMDLGVFDPKCGNWVARDLFGDRRSVRWSDLLPPTPASHNLQFTDVDGNGHVDVLSATSTGALLQRQQAVGSWTHQSYAAPSPPHLSHMRTTSLAMPVSLTSSEPVVVFQRGLHLDVLQPAHSTERLDRMVVAQQVELQYLRSFTGFDHFTSFRQASCDVFALGVGLFSEEAGVVPRQLHALRWSGEDQFVAEPLEVGMDTVTAFQFAQGSSLGVAIGELDGENALAVGHVGCSRFDSLGVFSIDFDWRTVAAPAGFTEGTLDKSNGVQFAAFATEDGEVLAMHYDGFDVRTFCLEEQTEGRWSLRQDIHHVHETRSDLASR